jgi:hypothetical protein
MSTTADEEGLREAIMLASFAVAAHATTLTWVTGSTTRVGQVIGDCDRRGGLHS